MPASNTLKIAEGLVRKIKSLSPQGTHVVRTYYRRFDADKTMGRWVYVVPREDEQADASKGADRGDDVFLHTFTISVVERLPANVVSFGSKDCWVDDRVDYVTKVRDALDEARDYDLDEGLGGANPVEGLDLVPETTGPREICDVDLLNETGIFLSEFDHTIREG